MPFWPRGCSSSRRGTSCRRYLDRCGSNRTNTRGSPRRLIAARLLPAVALPTARPCGCSSVRTRNRAGWTPSGERQCGCLQGSSGSGCLLTEHDSGSGLLTCQFLPQAPEGTSAKFDCTLRDGTTIKVKYGRNSEIHAETAATRLLSRLGFPADTVAIVPRLRCYGCPRFPFVTMRLLSWVSAEHLLDPHGYTRGYTDFEQVAVEWKFPAPPIETPAQKGWAWFELEPSPVSSADHNALRLLAVFLAHWDNKSENQRVVCLDGEPMRPDQDCQRPLALMQDLGATFGPSKVNLATWKARPVWADRKTCAVSMRGLPYDGATFNDVRISEAGRAQLVRQLTTPLGRGDPGHLCGGALPRVPQRDRRLARPRCVDVSLPGARRSDSHGRAVLTANGISRAWFVRLDSNVTFPTRNRTRVDRVAGTADRLIEDPVAGDLEQHEVVIGVESLRRHQGAADIASPQRARTTGNEIGDAVLRRRALIEMLVAGQGHPDIVTQENRLERRTQNSCTGPA